MEKPRATRRLQCRLARLSIEPGFDVAPQVGGRAHRRQLFGEADAEAYALVRFVTSLTFQQVRGDTARLVVAQLAVAVGRKFFDNVLVKHLSLTSDDFAAQVLELCRELFVAAVEP